MNSLGQHDLNSESKVAKRFSMQFPLIGESNLAPIDLRVMREEISLLKGKHTNT